MRRIMKQRLIGVAVGLVVGLIGLSLLLVGPLSPNRTPAQTQATQTAQATEAPVVSESAVPVRYSWARTGRDCPGRNRP